MNYEEESLDLVSDGFDSFIIMSGVTKTQFKRGKYLYKIERTEVR